MRSNEGYLGQKGPGARQARQLFFETIPSNKVLYQGEQMPLRVWQRRKTTVTAEFISLLIAYLWSVPEKVVMA